MGLRRPREPVGFAILLSLVVFACGGCATSPLKTARQDFYRGDYRKAAALLEADSSNQQDRVMVLMERGMVQQARGDYAGSIQDWRDAAQQAEQLDYYSLSRGTASYVVNDQVLAFRGAPYERTLLHAFAAKSYMAMGMWDDAAVEARNIIYRLEHLYGFPDDPYSHYLAGVCLEMVNAL